MRVLRHKVACSAFDIRLERTLGRSALARSIQTWKLSESIAEGVEGLTTADELIPKRQQYILQLSKGRNQF